jgi:hypothetical protein
LHRSLLSEIARSPQRTAASSRSVIAGVPSPTQPCKIWFVSPLSRLSRRCVKILFHPPLWSTPAPWLPISTFIEITQPRCHHFISYESRSPLTRSLVPHILSCRTPPLTRSLLPHILSYRTPPLTRSLLPHILSYRTLSPTIETIAIRRPRSHRSSTPQGSTD